MPRVLQDHGRGPGQVLLAKGTGAVGAEPCGHARAGRSAPEGIALRVHLQLPGVGKDPGDGAGQVLAGGLRAGAVDQGKGVVAALGELQRVGEAVLHGPDVGKAAARVADGKGRARLPFEEEQAGVRLVRVLRLLRLGIDVVEHRLARLGALPEGVDDLHRLLRVDVVVPGQLQFAQRVAAPIAGIHREEQAAIVPKDLVLQDRLDRRVRRKRACGFLLCRFLLRGFLLRGFLLCGLRAVRSPGAAPGQAQDQTERGCEDCRSLQRLSRSLHGPHYKKIEASKEVSIRYSVFTYGFTVFLFRVAFSTARRKFCTRGEGSRACSSPKGIV